VDRRSNAMNLRQVAIYVVVILLALKFRVQISNALASIPGVGAPLNRFIG